MTRGIRLVRKRALVYRIESAIDKRLAHDIIPLENNQEEVIGECEDVEVFIG
jgi:hypothetical protein